MLNLTDFFAPLSISNLLIYFSFVACCEIIGYWLAISFIGKIPHFLRGATWLLGLGLVVFMYFLSHFFVPFTFPTILFVLLVLVIPSIKIYIKNNGWKSLLIFLKRNALVAVFILLVLPKVFVKASLPPYIWDEMAYHYISPYTLHFEKAWNTGSSFYQNLPRLLETAFIALFSLTKTYSVARIFHFSIFITFLMAVYAFLKKNFGLAVAVVFFLLTIFYKENFLLWSTFGYVDVGTTSFVMIGFISFLDYLFGKKISSLQFSIAFFGMAVGSKYSALVQLLPFVFISAALLFKNKGLAILSNKKLLVGFSMFIVLGGYWYIKNFIVLGNPLYPFIFGCRFENCETKSLGYTTPLIFSNISLIYRRVFLNNIFLQTMFIIGTIFSLVLGTKKAKKMVLFILIYVAIEIILIKNISGFKMRYLYHWQVLSILIIVAPLSALIKMNTLQLFWKNIRRKGTHET